MKHFSPHRFGAERPTLICKSVKNSQSRQPFLAWCDVCTRTSQLCPEKGGCWREEGGSRGRAWKVRRRQETGGPAGCRGFEPNRWWRLGDVPSPGLSAVIEDNLSTQREQACPLSGRGKGGEVNMKKILHYHRLCVASRVLSLVPDLILASGCEDEDLSPWVGV